MPPGPLGNFVACVVNHGRTYDATFGYLNQNTGDVVIPIGPNNAVTPGPANQRQPETFRPGFTDAAFTVHGISASKAVNWTLSFGGQVRVATATANLPLKCLHAAIDPVGDLAATKHASPRTVQVAQRVHFTIVVRNTGGKVLRPATVADTLPASQLAILSVTTTQGRCQTRTVGGFHQVACAAPAPPPGESFTIHITARAIGPGSATDHARVVGLPNDPTAADNSATATVDIRHPPSPPPPSFTG